MSGITEVLGCWLPAVSQSAGALLWGAEEVQPGSLQALASEWPGSWAGPCGALWGLVGPGRNGRSVGAAADGRRWGEQLPAAEPFSAILVLGAGDLESFKKQSFVLKEGVEYRIKISFRVRQTLREVLGGLGPGGPPPSSAWVLSPQVNREIVSGMKYIQHTYRKGVKSEWGAGGGGA